MCARREQVRFVPACPTAAAVRQIIDRITEKVACPVSDELLERREIRIRGLVNGEGGSDVCRRNNQVELIRWRRADPHLVKQRNPEAGHVAYSGALLDNVECRQIQRTG